MREGGGGGGGGGGGESITRELHFHFLLNYGQKTI